MKADEAGAIVWRGKVGSTPEALAAAIEAAGGGATPEGTGGERSDALRRPPQPSEEPAAVVGAELLPCGGAVGEVWALYQAARAAVPGGPSRDRGGRQA